MAARGALLLVASLLLWSCGFAQASDDPTCSGTFSTQSRYNDAAAVSSNTSYWCCNSYTSTYPSGLPLPSSSLEYPAGWSLPTTTGPRGMAFNYPCHVGGTADGDGSGVDTTPGVNFGKKISVVTSCPTVDRWGTLGGQCDVPGYGGAYPATFNQQSACNSYAGSQPLFSDDEYDQIPYATAYFFKDYSDVLYVTVSLAPTGWRA